MGESLKSDDSASRKDDLDFRKAIVSIEENLKQQVRDNVAANHQKFALATGSMTADAGESGEITNETLKEKHASTEMKRALAAQARQNIDEERNRHTQKMMELEGKVHERLKEVQKREHEVFAAEHMLERELETGETTLSNVQWHAAKEEQRHGTLTGILGRTEDTLKSKYKSKIPPHPYSFVEGAQTHENGSPLVFLSRRHQAR
ncbi:hypothetical protein BESB_041160 [Besnoitia besnoiti]|uniref:Uncharacterized protein n=1 Tax=Besnoitia besnoiti TaxID=94643 RepID=A0A2A9MGM1_BESBE|nr:hypothetical protein BESB_041160 [Besnoitia besnoiti]PFH37658.1 hypothetical protein BESB_041160 [Besnoitia besnoiti]